MADGDKWSSKTPDELLSDMRELVTKKLERERGVVLVTGSEEDLARHLIERGVLREREAELAPLASVPIVECKLLPRDFVAMLPRELMELQGFRAGAVQRFPILMDPREYPQADVERFLAVEHSHTTHVPLRMERCMLPPLFGIDEAEPARAIPPSLIGMFRRLHGWTKPCRCDRCRARRRHRQAHKKRKRSR